MNYFRSLLPSYIPPEIAEKGELMVWRERIIQTIGIAAMGVAIFVFFFLLPGVIAEGNPVMIGAYISLVVYLAALIFIRRLPYAVRGNLLLIAILTAGVISFIQYGLSGNGRVLLLTYTILTAALFGLRPGLNALGLSMLTMGIFGFGMVTGFIPTPAPEVLMNTSNPREWLIGSVFLSFGAIMGITTNLADSTSANSGMAHKQVAEFMRVMDTIKQSSSNGLYYSLESSGTLWMNKHAEGTLVRVGHLLYGLVPGGGVSSEL
ncbi:MAG: hypothetical protein HGA86_06445, partial [Anaerolineaceae bacterium]|nr:hypothetical protein [Anaerolineaceae bacterium]